jgi:hypothetical protein
LFRKQDEVTGIRDYGELGVGNEPKGLQCVFRTDKIMISHGDQNWRFG